MSDFDELIRRHYECERMSPERVRTLLSRESSKPPLQPVSRRGWILGMGAGLGTAAAAGWLGATWVMQRSALDGIASDIAANHLKQLPMDVASDDFERVGRHLALLALTLRRPAGLNAEAELTGGRYCSLDGRLAAQLRLKHGAHGETRTLFATRATARLQSFGSGVTRSDGVAIRYWSEDGVFFAYASAPR